MTKISQLTDIGGSLAANDEFIIRDVSDISTPNKKVTASGFFNVATSLGFTGLDLIAAGAGPQSRVRCTSSGSTHEVVITTATVDRFRVTTSGNLASTSLGSSAAPIYTFANDLNSGFYSPGADRLGLTAGGVDRILINPSGIITGSDTSVFATGRIVSTNFQTGVVNLVLHTGTAPSGISGTNLFKQIQPGFYEVVAFGLPAYGNVGPSYALTHALFSVDFANIFTTISSNVRVPSGGSASWNTSTNYVYASFGDQSYQNYPNLFFRRLGYYDNTL